MLYCLSFYLLKRQSEDMILKILLVSLSFLTIQGCSLFNSSGSDSEEGTQEELDEGYGADFGEIELLSEAMRSYDAERFTVAKNMFNKLVGKYPSSPLSVFAELKIADSIFYGQKHIESVPYYREFIRVHNTHEALPYAYFQIARAYQLSYKGTGHDETPLKEARKVYEKIIEDYPASSWAKDSKQEISTCEQSLLESELAVLKFYEKKGQDKAARARLDFIKSNYSDSLIDENTVAVVSSDDFRVASNVETSNVETSNVEVSNVNYEDIKEQEVAEVEMAKLEADIITDPVVAPAPIQEVASESVTSESEEVKAISVAESLNPVELAELDEESALEEALARVASNAVPQEVIPTAVVEQPTIPKGQGQLIAEEMPARNTKQKDYRHLYAKYETEVERVYVDPSEFTEKPAEKTIEKTQESPAEVAENVVEKAVTASSEELVPIAKRPYSQIARSMLAEPAVQEKASLKVPSSTVNQELKAGDKFLKYAKCDSNDQRTILSLQFSSVPYFISSKQTTLANSSNAPYGVQNSILISSNLRANTLSDVDDFKKLAQENGKDVSFKVCGSNVDRLSLYEFTVQNENKSDEDYLALKLESRNGRKVRIIQTESNLLTSLQIIFQ